MTPEEIQLCREYLNKERAGVIGLLEWIHEMRTLPGDESPADLEARLLEDQDSNDLASKCLDILERGEELPPYLAKRFYGWES
jgi:hypothetical protein